VNHVPPIGWAFAVALGACSTSDRTATEDALVHGHDCDAALIAEAERVLRPAVPLLRALSGRPATDDMPGSVNLHATVAGYERVARTLAPDRVGNMAFTHHASRAAHVALQPPSSAVDAGLPWLTRQLLLHELAHLVVNEAFANARRHPTFVAEGLASWLQARATQSLGWHADLGEDPYWATKFALAARGDAAVPDVGTLLLDRPSPGTPLHRRYAIAFGAFAVLAEAPDAFARFVTTLQALPDDRALPRRLHDRLLANGDLAAWQQAVATRGTGLPRWQEERRSLDTSRRPWLQTAFPDHAARCWRLDAAAATQRTIVVEFEAGSDTPPPAMHVLLGRTTTRWLRVEFGVAGVAVDEIDATTERPSRRLASTPVSLGLRPGHVVRAAVQSNGGAIVVAVEGVALLRLATTRDEGLGPWGLGVAAGTTGRWHRARCE